MAGGSSWALYNLILTILTSLLSIALLEGYFKDQKEEEEESDEQIMALAMKEEEPEEKKIDRKLVTRILSIVFSIGALILFFLTEDMTNPMSLTDKWTVWHVIIALIQCVDALLSKKSKDEEEKADEGSLERA